MLLFARWRTPHTTPTPSPPQFHTPMHCSSIWFITQTCWRFYSDCNSFKTSEKKPPKTSLRFPESLWWNYNVHSYYIGSNRQFETKKKVSILLLILLFFASPRNESYDYFQLHWFWFWPSDQDRFLKRYQYLNYLIEETFLQIGKKKYPWYKGIGFNNLIIETNAYLLPNKNKRVFFFRISID